MLIVFPAIIQQCPQSNGRSPRDLAAIAHTSAAVEGCNCVVCYGGGIVVRVIYIRVCVGVPPHESGVTTPT